MTGTLNKVPVTIVTGFLGAGKTTLIRHVLESVRGRRLALIVNEFGDVGVDGEILRSCGAESCPDENIVELANGCLCCTVADDFVPTIEALLAHEKRPDHIVVETSGLALPKPLVKAFDWPDLRARVTVDGVIAVIDAPAVAEGRFADDPEAVQRQRAADPSIEHENPLEEVYQDQLLCADLVILNKADLLEHDGIRHLASEISAVAPRAKIVVTEKGRIEPNILLGIAAAAEDDLAHRPSRHDAEEGHDHDDFDTFVVDVPAPKDAGAFVERLKSVAADHDILRMKGFVEIAGRPLRLLVQGVGARFSYHFDRPWRPDESRASRLVVIGQKGLDRSAITAALTG